MGRRIHTSPGARTKRSTVEAKKGIIAAKKVDSGRKRIAEYSV